MKYGFTLDRYVYDDEHIWVARSKDLKGCIGQGDTPEAAIKEYSENEEIWLESAKKFGIPIPEPSSVKEDENYSGKLTIRIGGTNHKLLAEMAKKEGLSINQYINNMISSCATKDSVVDIAKKELNTYTKQMMQISDEQYKCKPSSGVSFSFGGRKVSTMQEAFKNDKFGRY